MSTDGAGVRETCSIENISWLQGKNPILSPQCYINIPQNHGLIGDEITIFGTLY